MSLSDALQIKKSLSQKILVTPHRGKLPQNVNRLLIATVRQSEINVGSMQYLCDLTVLKHIMGYVPHRSQE